MARLSDEELYRIGVECLRKRGEAEEEIDFDDKDYIITVGWSHAFFEEGRETMETDVTLISETGENLESRPLQAYYNESYEEALKRILDETGEPYDPDDILKSAIWDEDRWMKMRDGSPEDQLLFSQVKSVIDEWNPVGIWNAQMRPKLVELYPNNRWDAMDSTEYDVEIGYIADQIRRIPNIRIDVLADGIRESFIYDRGLPIGYEDILEESGTIAQKILSVINGTM